MEGKRLTFIEHLEELRIGIIKSLGCIIIASILAYTFTDKIFANLTRPLGGTLVFIAPQEAFVTNIKIALFMGFYFSLPFILYQLWRFIAQGLHKGEMGHVSLLAFLSFLFFIIGSCFGYFVIVPVAVKFLLGFGKGFAVPMISVDKYVSFVTVLTFVFGLAFELPIAILLFSKAGIVTPQYLSANRRYAVVIIFIVAAIFTPPDVVSQCLLAVPLLALYELSIILTRLLSR
jgi:sec-independent protein translocase protein TatC